MAIRNGKIFTVPDNVRPYIVLWYLRRGVITFALKPDGVDGHGIATNVGYLIERGEIFSRILFFIDSR